MCGDKRTLITSVSKTIKTLNLFSRQLRAHLRFRVTKLDFRISLLTFQSDSEATCSCISSRIFRRIKHFRHTGNSEELPRLSVGGKWWQLSWIVFSYGLSPGNTNFIASGDVVFHEVVWAICEHWRVMVWTEDCGIK